MMELVKKHIHMNRRSGSVASQMTLDDDFNVPDTMEDVEQLILERGEIQIESAKNQGEKVEVRGRLDFRVLYRTPGGRIRSGSVRYCPFREINRISTRFCGRTSACGA